MGSATSPINMIDEALEAEEELIWSQLEMCTLSHM
jgi:hypothetical protein